MPTAALPLLCSLSLCAAVRLPPSAVRPVSTARAPAPQPALSCQADRPSAALPPLATAETWLLGAAAAMSLVPMAGAGDVSWVGPAKLVLSPVFTIFTLLFLFRTVLSWFPKYDLNAFPYNIAAWPTETILKGTRKFIPPVAGVDITPIVWVAIISFFSEILLGPQGLLTIVQRKGGF